MNIKEAAQTYLSRGLSVIPLNGKIPAIKWTGYQKLLASKSEVAEWYDGTGKNIGIVTGKLSGLSVIDFDTEEAYQDAKQRGLPRGPTVKTGRGYHLYCQHQDGLRNFQKRDDLPGIDLRAEGGQVVAPPSIHQNGKRYEWLVTFDEATLPTVPEWLIAKPTEKKPIKELYSGSDTGSRNDTLARLLGSWVNDGGVYDDVLQQALVWNESNKPPLPRVEVEKTVKSIFETHHRNKPEKKHSGLNVVDIESFLKMTFPPRETLLSPWLPAQGLCMVYAPRGVGKTHFSLGVAYAVASGGQFLQWSAEKPRGVLFIDGEMPGNVLQERISTIAVSNENEPSAPLKIITPDLQPEGMLNLSDTADQKLITPYLEGIDLIIIDNLSTLCRSGKEAEGESWLPVQQWSLQQRAAGRSVLFIHHAGKNGEQRGTSRREDVLDTVISLKRPGDYTPDKGACFEIHFEKARGLYGDDTKPVEAMLTTGQDQTQTWAIKELEQSTAEKVAALLNEGIEQREIAEMIGLTKGAVSKAKKKAQHDGLLGVS